jgi:hypothetical protein
MVSRGVWQLCKVNVRFCKYGGSSSGLRDLLSTEKLDNWLDENPAIELDCF